MEPILIYADPESSEEHAANIFKSCRMYKPQPVSVPNNTRSKHSERNRDVFRPVGTMASGPPVQNVPRDIFCTYISRSLAYHQTRERKHIGLERHHDSHQNCQRNAVEEHVTQDAALVAVPIGSRAGHYDTLRVDHLTHHTP